MTEELHLTKKADWREWLGKNHANKNEVWLIYYKTHTGKRSISYDDAVEEALCFGWVDSIIKKLDDDKFARKFTPRKDKSKWSEANKKRAVRMMNEGKMTEVGLARVREAEKNGAWFAIASHPKELEIPQFVKEALATNKRALDNFNNLAKSCKRQYVGWIMSAKREETRKKRLAEAIKKLKKNEKLGMK